MQTQYISVTFKDFGIWQKIFKTVYKCMRLVQITAWFYFLPFIALLGSYLVPFLITRGSLTLFDTPNYASCLAALNAQ